MATTSITQRLRAGEAAAVLALTVISCAAPRAPAPVVEPELHLVVAWGGDGVAVKNVDPSKKDYRNVELKLNMKQFGENSGEAGAGMVSAGKTVVVPFFNFVDDELHRFNIQTTAIVTIFVKAEVEGKKSSALFLCQGQVCQRAPD